MNSRERVQAAVDFRETDRVPIDLGSSPASGINAVAYTRLKERMGVTSRTKVLHGMAMLAEVEAEMVDRLQVDVLPVDVNTALWCGQAATEGLEKRLFDGTTVHFQPGTRIVEDDNGDWLMLGEGGEALARMPANGFYFDLLQPTMSGWIDPRKHTPPTTVPDEVLDVLAQRAALLYENTDKALLGWGGNISILGLSGVVSLHITQGALDEWLVMLMAEKQTAHEMMARSVDSAIALMELYHQAVGDRCFAWGVGVDDAGTQRACLVRPELFEEMIVPHYKRLCDWVHEHTAWKTFLHCCGSIREYIPYWVQAGIDILNPVQISAANMQPESLKTAFGDSLVFWGGGCDTQRVLPRAAADEVRAHVRRNLEIFSPGGGFVFSPVHNVQQDVPVENIEAMFETVHAFRRTPATG